MGIIPTDNRTPFDVREVTPELLMALASTSSNHAMEILGLWICQNTWLPVGIVANNGILFSDHPSKALTLSNYAVSVECH